ncbi:MAG: hypothetical protein QMD85_05630, partial [Candidatus Aenigmarchaeota archaeon]|nr:hypothetical protein [Candidatus Aenigmarchaeota archaeon]
PSVSSFSRGHIDCDYQIIEDLNVIYVGRNVWDSKGRKALKNMEEIAREHNYDLRNYKTLPGYISLISGGEEFIEHDEKRGMILHEPPPGHRAFSRYIKVHTGINFIVNENSLFTGFIHPNEEVYLRSKGMQAVEIPLGMMDAGAGLRCIYGEFTLP